MEYLQQLNTQQREAATTTEGYVRVVAGAGSGKTKTLTARYLYLVEQLGISTANILCVTFTNKAAAEMKKRIRSSLPDQDLGRITTFHGFCVGLLKEDCHVVQYPSTFIVLDEEDKEAMLRTVFEDLGITSRDMTVKDAVDHIGWRKGGRGYVKNLIGAPEKLLRLSEEATTLKDKVMYRYFYEQRKCYGLDFDDLVYFVLYILQQDRDTREKWQQRLEYVMVDEFQDIDKDQYALADILSGYHKNLFVVGDPDQTIYTWRGADVKFILEFDSRHENVKTIYLNTNYRSAPQILKASNALIDKNRQRLKKELTAVRPDARKPLYFHARTGQLEADWMTANMRALHDGGRSWSSMAVLYRAHYVSRTVEESLIRNRIPYVLYSGVEFYKRKEIKDVLCYLRMIYAGDDISFLRTVNEPRRGVGRTRIAALKEYAALHRCSLYDALAASLDTRLFQRSRAKEYVRLIEKYRAIFDGMDLTDLLAGVLSESGYEEMLRSCGEEERLDNLAELKQAIYDFQRKAGEEVTLGNYLDHAALFTNMDQTARAEAVKLMTVHAAKGLEFPTVFLCGLSEGIFPGKRANTREKLEEERRLCYVAFTRAQDRLFLSDAAGSNYDGSFRYPSRFLFNAEKENVEYAVPLDPELEERAMEQIRKTETMDASAARPNEAVGKRILHPVFGEGSVIGIPRGCDGIIVQFDSIHTPRTFGSAAKITYLT
ncbi:MAG: UvrD-helicase domain-containing protein [Oscillospiraceae bacterium]|nr:UvrD-helicase domain-containing protein [Oscillospiraceae bacterium]MBQ7129502.1 UvrD-helicase domain-containing protein [Oscillospiraceae bacterium]